MKALAALPFFLLLCLLAPGSDVWSMPPHPDLLTRIQNQSAPEPYYLQHFDELHAAGIDNPGYTRTIEQLRRRSLDEDINILAILVDFSDHTSRVSPVYFDSLLYGHRQATLNHYYQQISYGNLTLVTLNLPSTLGWERAPETYAYYVNNSNGTGSYPQNAQRLTEDCIHLVDDSVDFSQYDNDGDGHVDALFIIHSGPGAEFTGRNSDIWSHAWVTATPQHVDGVIADRYSIEPEYWQALNDMTCGVYAHEMGHAVFGLPDLYDTGYTSSGLGTWTLMAGGSWNGNNGNSPAHPDAWCRIQMGFAQAINVTSNLSNISIPNIEQSPVIYRLWSNGSQGNEYFLVENRQQRGYDIRLRGNGLLIYHIDDNVHGNDNPWYPGHTGGGHYQVALEQADGLYDLERNSNSGDANDPYPSWDSLSFSNGTVPGSRSWSGAITRVAVRNISPSADTITADLAVTPGPGNLVIVQLPDTNVIPNDTVRIPVMIDSVTGQNITAFQFTLQWDSTVAQSAAPYVLPQDGMIPASWTVTATHTLGTVTVNASGTTPLAGEGRLLYLPLFVLTGAPEGTASPLAFSLFSFNAGNPPADVNTGSLTVSAAHIILQPGSLSFGNVQVHQQSTRTVIVRNSGSAALILRSAVTSGGAFTTTFSGPVSVLPGHWSPVPVTFAPDTVGAYRDTLTITSNASEGTLLLPLSGQGTSLNADGSPSGLPTVFALSQAYPNPFNPSTVLNYDVPRNARVTLSVFDVLGREVDTPLRGVVEPGHYSLNWSCPSCAGGIYLFVLSAEGRTFVQKAVLIK